MSCERNNDTQESLKREIKAMQEKCVNVCQMLDNALPEEAIAESEEATSTRINNYIQALRTEVHNSTTKFFTDDNLLTSQFHNEMKKKTEQVEEMVAFVKGNVHDTDKEINRLQTLIEISKEAKQKPKTNKAEIKPEHLQKARDRFQILKETLHSLIRSLFPDCHELMIEVLGDLMSAKLKDNPNSYMPITPDNYKLMKLLKDINVVTPNPYNNTEVKLAYY